MIKMSCDDWSSISSRNNPEKVNLLQRSEFLGMEKINRE
jgi:hypothetical protein